MHNPDLCRRRRAGVALSRPRRRTSRAATDPPARAPSARPAPARGTRSRGRATAARRASRRAVSDVPGGSEGRAGAPTAPDRRPRARGSAAVGTISPATRMSWSPSTGYTGRRPPRLGTDGRRARAAPDVGARRGRAGSRTGPGRSRAGRRSTGSGRTSPPRARASAHASSLRWSLSIRSPPWITASGPSAPDGAGRAGEHLRGQRLLGAEGRLERRARAGRGTGRAPGEDASSTWASVTWASVAITPSVARTGPSSVRATNASPGPGASAPGAARVGPGGCERRARSAAVDRALPQPAASSAPAPSARSLRGGSAHGAAIPSITLSRVVCRATHATAVAPASAKPASTAAISRPLAPSGRVT